MHNKSTPPEKIGQRSQDVAGSGSNSVKVRSKVRLRATRASQVPTRLVHWLWEGRIAFGQLNAIVGDPGLGKTTVALDLAARVSRGWNMPVGSLGTSTPQDVLVLSAEDDAAITLVPRLKAAGADLDRIDIVTVAETKGGDETVSFPNHMDALRDHVQEGGARLVIIDPFFAYLSPGLSPNSDPDVRQALTPLSHLAEDTDCAILLIHHPNKSVGMTAMHRISGSVGISAALRMALLLAKDPDKDTRLVLASLKSNLGAPAPSITFSLETDADSTVPRIDWGELSPHSAESLLSGGYRSGPTKGDQANDFLKATLARGPVRAVDLGQKRDAAGISGRTLERARTELGVVSKPLGFRGDRYVMLPEHVESFEGRDRDGSLYLEELAESGQARPPDPCGEATSSESARMAESGSPPEEFEASVRHSVRHDGGDWKNGFVEGDSRSSSSSVRHLQGKADSLEEDGTEVEW